MKKKCSVSLASFLVCSALFLMISGPAHAIIAVEIPGIPGDSTVAGFENLIIVTSTGSGFGLNACEDIVITKQLDRATPLLIAAAVAGTVFPEVEVSFAGPNGGVVDTASNVFLSLRLERAVIKRVSSSALSGQLPVEELRISAQSVVIKYNAGDEMVEREVFCRRRMLRTAE